VIFTKGNIYKGRAVLFSDVVRDIPFTYRKIIVKRKYSNYSLLTVILFKNVNIYCHY